MMRTVSFLLAALLAAMFPASASAAVTYTCSESALAPISVVDPMGGDAQRVSEFISRCTAANGTASGPTEGAACDGGGRWATVQSQMVCQPATLTAAAQLSDACIKQNQCSASENAFLDNQKAVQNDPRSVPLDATAQQRLLEQAQQAQAQANAQATRVVAAPANNNAFCQGGTCTYVPLEPLPVPGGAQSGTDFGAFMSGVFRVLITFGGLFSVVMLTVAGIGYMVSESAVDIDRAKGRARAALWGLLLLVGSWLILNTINPEILNFTLLRGKIQQAGSGIQTPTGSTGNASAAGTSQPDNAAKSACELGSGAYKQTSPGVWDCVF